MGVGADTPPSCAALAAFRLMASMPAPATPLCPEDEVGCPLYKGLKDVDEALVWFIDPPGAELKYGTGVGR